MLGHWKNFEELETALSLQELEALLEASRKIQHEQNKFLAALKGINLNESTAAEDRVQAIKDRVAAQQEGMDEESYAWKQAGLGFEIEEE